MLGGNFLLKYKSPFVVVLRCPLDLRLLVTSPCNQREVMNVLYVTPHMTHVVIWKRITTICKIELTIAKCALIQNQREEQLQTDKTYKFKIENK